MTLDREARQVFAELELISHGATASYNPGSGNTDTAYPPGELFPPHIDYRLRYQRCDGDTGRRNVIQAARDELEHIKGGEHLRRKARGPENEDQRAQRIISSWEGEPAGKVAATEGLKVTTVCQIRRDAGRDPGTGVFSQEDLRAAERARHLQRSGLTQRQIALYLHLSQPTIHRYLRAA